MAAKRSPAAGRLSLGEPLRRCEYLVAAGPGDAGRLDIADVIICEADDNPARAAHRLQAMFSCYPGCAVAAVRVGPSACLAAARCGTIVAFAVRERAGASGMSALACASVAYGCLCAGRPLTSLDRATVEVSVAQACLYMDEFAYGGVVPCSLPVNGGPSPDRWRACRWRICVASGTPRSS